MSSFNNKEVRNRKNEEIRASKVLVIDEDGSQLGILATEKAIATARAKSMDLVEVSPNAEPPVTKIMDFNKFRYDQTSKRKEADRKQKKMAKIKEIKLRPSTDSNDYEVKLRNLRGFLDEGYKVKVTVWFRGREMSHHELGMELLKRVLVDSQEHGKPEFMPKFEGRQMITILAPSKK